MSILSLACVFTIGPMDISNLTQFGREFHDLTKVQTTSSGMYLSTLPSHILD